MQKVKAQVLAETQGVPKLSTRILWNSIIIHVDVIRPHWHLNKVEKVETRKHELETNSKVS